MTQERSFATFIAITIIAVSMTACTQNPLMVTSVSPNYASQNRQEPVDVTITGYGFYDNGTSVDWVRIGGHLISNVVNINESSLVVTLPPGSDPPGIADVVIGRSRDGVTTQLPEAFLFYDNALEGLFTLPGYAMPASCADNRGIAVMDLNEDGYDDFVMANAYFGVRVYISDPSVEDGIGSYRYETFTKVEKAGSPGQWQYVGGAEGVLTVDVALFTITGSTSEDGTYLFVANAGANTLFKISCQGTTVMLEDRCYLLPSDGNRPAMRCSAGDLDGDGIVDKIVVVNGRLNNVNEPSLCQAIKPGERSDLYLTEVYTISVEEGAVRIGLLSLEGDDGQVCRTMADFGDVNNDGFKDLVLADFGRAGGNGWPNELYLYDADGGDFVRVTDPLLFPDLQVAQPSVAVRFAEVNNDILPGQGNADFFVLNFQDTNRLYLNTNNSSGDPWLGFRDASDKLPLYAALPFGMKSHHDAAFVDVNEDDWIDVVIVGENNHYYLNQGSVWDPEQEQDVWLGYRLVQEEGWNDPRAFSSVSIGLADVNKDGTKDVVAGGFVEQNRLYINHGDGQLQDVTILPGVFPSDGEMTFKAAFGTFGPMGQGPWPIMDFIVLANGSWSTDPWHNVNRIYVNDGYGGFTDETVSLFESTGRYSERSRDVVVFFSDALVGEDGPFLFFANDTDPNRLYRWDSETETFNELGLSTALRAEGDKTSGVAAADFDQDGYTDLVLVSMNGPPKVFFNEGPPDYFETATPVELPGSSGSMGKGVAAGRLDQDEYPDIVVANTGPLGNGTYGNQVYYYKHPRSFTSGYKLPNSQRLYSNAVELAFVNNDDLLDILIANGGVGGPAGNEWPVVGGEDSLDVVGQPNSLYINNGDGTFIDRSDVLPEAREGGTYSASAGVDAADLDQDSLIDLIVWANYPQGSLYGIGPLTRVCYVYHGSGERFSLFDLTEPMFSLTDRDSGTNARAVVMEDFAWSAAFGDVNGDHIPDLLITTDGQNRLLITGRP